MKYRLILITLLLTAIWNILQEPCTAQVLYRGHITVDDENYTGSGHFRFAIIDAAGTVLWSTGKLDENSGTPNDSVALPVTDGEYRVVLGDGRFGMKPIDPQVLAMPSELKLQIWFDDGEHGFALVADGIPLASAFSAGDSPPQSADHPLPEDAGNKEVTAELRRLRTQVDLLTARSNAADRQMLAELRQIRSLLAKPQAAPPAQKAKKPARVKLPLRNNPALGSPDAPVTIVEFTDYQCPFCRRFHDQTFPEIKEKFIDTGSVRFVSRNLPLTMHKHAQPAAIAALCAGEQGKYWEMRELLFKNNTALSPENLAEYARQLNLNVGKFDQCQAAPATQEAVEQDKADAQSVGITGTPTFVVGLSSEDILEGEVMKGAAPFAQYERVIETLLKTAEAQTAENKPADD